MGKIHELSAEVIDQISAGEVVERPSHMVKELMENSIDAGATEVEVEFNEGGRFVRVKDNGHGIGKEDLLLALNRHATSKITNADDLWSLKSFGFRGEALASISAVSRLKLTSRTKDDSNAHQLRCEFGKKFPIESVGGELGTTVLVERLFENVPARLKFLKSESAEGTQIKNVVKAMALAHPEVAIRLRSRGKLVAYCPQLESRKDRVQQILEVDSMYESFGECSGIKAQVIVAPPNKTAKTSRQIWVFVQNRWVQDRSLQAALLDGYRSLLMHGEFPIAALWVNCPLDEIDVNIHPTKSQVKFENASNAFRAVHRATRILMEEGPWVKDLVSPHMSDDQMKALDFTSPPAALNSPKGPSLPFEELSFQGNEFEVTQFKQKNIGSYEGSLASSSREMSSSLKSVEHSYSQKDSEFSGRSGEFLEAQPGQQKKSVSSGYWSQLQVLGQSDLTYIICQSRTALVIVDQHAAHERVAYERLMGLWQGGQIDIQNFLIPLTVVLEEDQVEAVMNESVEIEKLGIFIDQQGPTTIAVRSAPSLVSEKSLEAMMNRLGRELIENVGSFAIEKKISDICATLACHSVVRAGQALSREEMVSLLEQMDEFSMSSFCPHGRPVFVEYPFQKLERDFGRTV